MCRSYKAFLGVLFALGMVFMISTTVNADSLQGYEITSGENGGSFLVVDGKVVISVVK